MIIRRTESGLVLKIMSWSDYRTQKLLKAAKYKQSPEYQLWENSHKNNKT